MAGHQSRGVLFRKYALYFSGLVVVALFLSGATSLYFTYRDTRAFVDQLQQEKALGAAQRIKQFADTIEAQLKGALVLGPGATQADLQEQHFELLRLLRQAPAVADLKWVDPNAIQRMKVSRLAKDQVGVRRSVADVPGVAAALTGRTYWSSVYFRQESEPYLTVVTGGSRREAGALIADINLKFVWEVVSAIKIGESGYAYVVDASGRLISHPNISLVLQRTDLSGLPQVRDLLAARWQGQGYMAPAAADGGKRGTLSSHAAIANLGWQVLVEQSTGEAFAPILASALRTGMLVLFGIAIAVGVSVGLARRMTAPIHTLQAGATRIGEGQLHNRVEVKTGDELEVLADQFNRMAERLLESYTGLEQKIEERTRQLDLANRAKSRFLAAASHDLRQPVHALGLYVAQFRDATTGEERRRLQEKIEASSTAVAELIEALLDISKLDAGTVQPQSAEFALQLVFNRLEASFSVAAQSKGLRFRIRPSRLRIQTDPMLLERILLNLAANAVRYTQEGGVLIAGRRRAGKARIEVWDTGIGIAADQQAHIFEEFYRAHAAGPDHGKGLGLGLAIVERLVGLMGINFTFRSVAGRGSVFVLEVPLAETAETTLMSPPDRAATMRFDGARVLVLDDDAAALDAAAGLLAKWGCDVVACGNGAEALSALQPPAVAPHAILSDYQLSNGELGTEVIKRIHQVCGRPIPAIVISGDITAEMRQAAQREGLHVLHKPLQAAKLRTLLHHVLSGMHDANARAGQDNILGR